MIQLTLTRRTLALIVVAFVAVAALATGAFVRTANAGAGFTDTAPWAADEINWLAANGIATGYASDNTFRPNNNITRAQAAFWFSNFNDNIVTPHVTDTTDVHGIADTSALATLNDVRAISSIEIVTAEVANPGGTTTLIASSVECPAGKRAIAGGARTESPVQHQITSSYPFSTRQWAVTWTSPTAQSFAGGTIWATCAPIFIL